MFEPSTVIANFMFSSSRPVTFYHILKLFQPPSPDAPTVLNAEGAVTPVIDTKKRLVSEFYDEIVFYEPSQMMQQMLNTIQPVTSGSWTHDTDCKTQTAKRFFFIY
jgi:YEATS domain-containing protein 4